MTKEDMKKMKQTIESHGSYSEEETEEIAKKADVISEKMIEKEVVKEEEEETKEKNKKIEEIEKVAKAEQDFRRGRRGEKTKEEIIKEWDPKTKLGLEVKSGKVKNLDELLNKNKKILEPEIVDYLINIKSDLISIGQSKGKFGGGKRRAWRQTQRKTKEGNVPTFSAMAVIGDEDGHVGIGSGKAKETLPARDKAIRKAKLNVISIKRTCASFDCSCEEKHTIPFNISGKSAGVRVNLMPAPQGTGLVVGNELKKVLKLAGIKDVYSKTFGKKRTSFNLVKACIDALKKTNRGTI